MITINNIMRPYRMKSLLRFNGFRMEKYGVYIHDKYNLKVDIGEGGNKLDVYKFDDFLKRYTKETLYDCNTYVWHDVEYERLLGWLICRLPDMQIPNFNYEKRYLLTKAKGKQLKLKL